MSTTGTGTAQDPFIVDTWADFITAVGTADAYVEVDTSQISVWDFPREVPSGLSSTVSWNAASVDGKGLTIKGLFGSASRFFSAATANTKIISNLNMLDIAKTNSTTGVFYGRALECRNCEFSGIIEAEYFFESFSGGTMTFTTGILGNNDPKGCSFSLKFSGNSRFSSGTSSSSAPNFYHSTLNLDGTSTSSTAQHFNLNDSKIIGGIPWNSLTLQTKSGGQNVIDADIENISTYTNSSSTICLINTDKLASGLSVPSGFTGVTSAQMLNAAYLESVGFHVEVEEEPEEEEVQQGGE